MNTVSFKDIPRNRYFFPILVGLIIAAGGFWIGKAKDKAESTEPKKEVVTVIEIKEKKDLKSLLFGQKNFSLTYSTLQPSLIENISFFEPDENWQGSGYLDWKNFYEGKSSLGAASNNRQPGTVFLEKKLDLSNFEIIEFYISLNDISLLETATIKVGDASLSNYYSYSLSNVKAGWNFIRIPRDQFVIHRANPNFGWKNIEKIQFEIISRPKTIVIANFDYLSAQKNTEYLGQWKTVDENILSLGKRDDKIVLIARNNGGAGQAVLSGVNGDSFTYQASFIPPASGGSAGLFFRGNYANGRGYYLLADGLNKSSFTLKKLGADGQQDLAKTEISNFVLEKNKKYWFRVETKGENIVGFISLDGQKYVEIFNVNDDEFKSGGVGVAVFGRSYDFFDDFKFSQ